MKFHKSDSEFSTTWILIESIWLPTALYNQNFSSCCSFERIRNFSNLNSVKYGFLIEKWWNLNSCWFKKFLLRQSCVIRIKILLFGFLRLIAYFRGESSCRLNYEISNESLQNITKPTNIIYLLIPLYFTFPHMSN